MFFLIINLILNYKEKEKKDDSKGKEKEKKAEKSVDKKDKKTTEKSIIKDKGALNENNKS